MFKDSGKLASQSIALIDGGCGDDAPETIDVLRKTVTSQLALGIDPFVESRSFSLIGPDGIETVLDVDDRQFIPETEVMPWRMICWLKLKFPYGSTVGTGWFAGPKAVITAGHCVYYKDFGGWVESIEVIPARDRDEPPKFGRTVSEEFESNEEWIAHKNPEYDFGCVFLKEPLGEKTGSFSIGMFKDTNLVKHGVNIAGYPKRKSDMPNVRGDHLFHHKNKIRALSEERLFYDVDTTAGQSGAPVWVHSDVDSKPIVVGIHANGVDDSKSGAARIYNSSPRITQEKFDAINSWVAQ